MCGSKPRESFFLVYFHLSHGGQEVFQAVNRVCNFNPCCYVTPEKQQQHNLPVFDGLILITLTWPDASDGSDLDDLTHIIRDYFH